MKPWYEQNPKLLQQEREVLAASCPSLQINVCPEGYPLNAHAALKAEAAVTRGTYSLRMQGVETCYKFGVSLLYPPDYPRNHPIMLCDDPKLPAGILDRHILSKGEACLGVRADIRRRWQEQPNIISFLDTIVAPFLVWQVYYEAFGAPPPWGERAHFGKGIEQYYAEALGLPETANIVAFIRLIARKNPPQGHELCPCGSGKKLRSCHHEPITRARNLIQPNDATIDLMQLESQKNSATIK